MRADAEPIAENAARRGPRVVPLAEATDPRFGGKARGLARLIEYGLPVPEGFAILGAGLDDGPLPDAVARAYSELATEAERAGGRPARVAVRSSAVGEDGEAASFAGQYDTVLGVEGEGALADAIQTCLRSASSERVAAYAEHGGHGGDVCVVVQRMVDARAAGVCFTADPVSQRRAHVVVDAVRGLGEALVSGQATPDHYRTDRVGRLLEAHTVGAEPILGAEMLAWLVQRAVEVEARFGAPIDLEWAIDAEGRLHWLQARPITTLEPDPAELDTPVEDPRHVFTRCNVGEMFPGPATPLAWSFTARSIDYGMQAMHRRLGIMRERRAEPLFISMFSGHLFLNLTTIARAATQSIGSSADQLCLSICGRLVDEYEIVTEAPPAWPLRVVRGFRYVRYLTSVGAARRRMAWRRAHFRIPQKATALEQWRAIDARLEENVAAMDDHLISSAGSGVLAPVLLGVLAKGRPPDEHHHAEVARLLAGADHVESADIAAGADRVVDAILASSQAERAFVGAAPGAALDWLRSDASGPAGAAFTDYLARHGHRAVRELELRQPGWADAPEPLVRSLQAAVRGRLAARDQGDAPLARRGAGADPAAALGPGTRAVVRLARATVRWREETKSGLVMVADRFKRAYRWLGARAVVEGRLPDADLVFFLLHEELGRLLMDGDASLVTRARERRSVLEEQACLQFPEVFQGEPRPLGAGSVRPLEGAEKAVVGKPVSRGRVVGRARIVRTLAEADALEVGEILVAPITDVGWTPYFSLIAGLVTDVGSAVSHGAVVARERRVPAVVNTRVGTLTFESGDWLLLDADAGVVRLASEAERASRHRSV